MSTHFQQVQRLFCDWIRRPEQDLSVSVERARMQVYRDLLFNNMCDFVDRVYPVARSLLPEQTWQQLKADFFSHGQCESPFYLDISLHFREYLSAVEHPVLQKYAWLAELLQVEWLELHLDVLDITPQRSDFNPQIDSVQQLISLAKTGVLFRLSLPIWVLAYQWPVYQWRVGELISVQHPPAPNVIVAWRDSNDHVRIEPVQPVTAIILEWFAARTDMVGLDSFDLHLRQAVPQWSQALQDEWVQHVLSWLWQRDLLVFFEPHTT